MKSSFLLIVLLRARRSFATTFTTFRWSKKASEDDESKKTKVKKWFMEIPHSTSPKKSVIPNVVPPKRDEMRNPQIDSLY